MKMKKYEGTVIVNLEKVQFEFDVDMEAENEDELREQIQDELNNMSPYAIMSSGSASFVGIDKFDCQGGLSCPNVMSEGVFCLEDVLADEVDDEN